MVFLWFSYSFPMENHQNHGDFLVICHVSCAAGLTARPFQWNRNHPTRRCPRCPGGSQHSWLDNMRSRRCYSCCARSIKTVWICRLTDKTDSAWIMKNRFSMDFTDLRNKSTVSTLMIHWISMWIFLQFPCWTDADHPSLGAQSSPMGWPSFTFRASWWPGSPFSWASSSMAVVFAASTCWILGCLNLVGMYVYIYIYITCTYM